MPKEKVKEDKEKSKKPSATASKGTPADKKEKKVKDENEKKEVVKKQKSQKYKKGKKSRQRSKRYQELRNKVKGQRYSAEEAIVLVKEISNTKFDESIEVHVRLGIDISKSDQHVKGTIKFPNPTGKKIKIAAFVDEDNQKKCQEAGAEITGGEELIDKIKKTKKTDFDIAVAEPKMMPKLGQIAKILGPKGLMPTPKNQTVSPDPEKTIKELMSGKAAFKNDSNGIIHLMIGKSSLDEKKLTKNLTAFLEELKKLKPEKIKGNFIKNITVCSTMGPGVKVKI